MPSPDLCPVRTEVWGLPTETPHGCRRHRPCRHPVVPSPSCPISVQSCKLSIYIPVFYWQFYKPSHKWHVDPSPTVATFNRIITGLTFEYSKSQRLLRITVHGDKLWFRLSDCWHYLIFVWTSSAFIYLLRLLAREAYGSGYASWVGPMATDVAVGYPLLVRRWRDQICSRSFCLCFCFRPFGRYGSVAGAVCGVLECIGHIPGMNVLSRKVRNFSLLPSI